jgi:hypothetical protein
MPMRSAVAPLWEEKREEQSRSMIHEKLDEWLDEVLPEVFSEDREPTLMEMSELLTRTRQKFLGEWLGVLIQEKYAELLDQEYAPCPACGRMRKKRLDSGKELVSMQGSAKIQRPWFYCEDCSLGYCPLDEVLQVSRKKHQFDIQKKSIKLAAEVTFNRGGELFEDLTGQPLSDHFIHETFEAVGSEARIEEVLPGRAEVAERIEAAAIGVWRPILVVASDGAHLPTRPKAGRKGRRGPGQWQEAKGFRIYLLGPDRIIHVASWHQIQKEDEFGKDLALAASRIPTEGVRIALLGDGAEWLWKHMRACFPEGREILDYYHCAEHIYKVAKVQYGEGTIEALQWAESTITRLFFAEVKEVIAGLRRMKPRTKEAQEEIRKLIGYLQNNREKIHYRSDRKGGYPIGSGGIESANKFISHTRLKRSGAWWIKENGNAMLRIRCAIYNGTYDRVFDSYKCAQLNKNRLHPLKNR